MGPIGRVLALAALGAALGAAALAIFLAAGATILITFDTDPPRLVSGVFPAERDEPTGLTFAWTGPDMTIRLPGLDRRREWTMEVRTRATRPDSASNPLLSFYADGVRISTHQSATAFETIHVVIPPRAQRPRGAVLRMGVSTTVVPGPNDARALGVMIDRVKIAPAGVVLPPIRALVGGALAAAALSGAIALIAAGPVAAGAALLVSVGQAAMLSRGFAPYTEYPITAAQVAAWIALGVALVSAWAHRGGARPLAATRFVVSFSAAVLFLKLLVLLHPQMPVGDAMFHAHRFQGVLAGNLYFTSIAPGNYTFPYPPGFYLFAAAFRQFVTRGAADMNLLRVVAVTVDALAGAMLYVAVRRSWNDAWIGAAAVVLYQMLPLEFRIFTVGNLTNAFAQSVSVFALVILGAGRIDRLWHANVALLTFVLAVSFMSHTSTFPILFCTCVFVTVLLRWKGDGALRPLSVAVLLAALLALGLAIALYYAHFGETYRAELSRISTETASAAPDAGGRDLAARARSVPTYGRSYLGLGALVLAALGAWDLYRRGARDRLTLATAGWALSCIVFLAIGIVTPVDMRYYLASVPAIAIAGAAGASALWSRQRPARIAAVALLVVVCWCGVVTWYTTLGVLITYSPNLGTPNMTLIEKISADMTAAMRKRDQARLMPLRMAKAALMNREVEKGRALDEGESQQVIASLIKQRRDSVEQFTNGGRAELAARETAEIAVLDAYVPPPLDPAEIERAVDEAVRETGASAAKDMGRVMKAVMPKLAGRGADGRTINEIVRRKLGDA